MPGPFVLQRCVRELSGVARQLTPMFPVGCGVRCVLGWRPARSLFWVVRLSAAVSGGLERWIRLRSSPFWG